MARELWTGNEALAEAAIRAGVEAYFGYPITPQTELLEYMARRMPELNRVFVQAESEIAAIHMVYGAACSGARAMTSSSSPGISLMQEGFSYIAGSEVPCVIVDIMRGGPGLGNIDTSQGDYFQVTKGAGHGDFRPIVLAPASVQEVADLMAPAFDLAERYRTIVIVAGDGHLGQMMEPIELPPMRDPPATRPDWALTGAMGRQPRTITSLYLGAGTLEEHNLGLQTKLARIQTSEARAETVQTNDAELLIVAFGTTARAALTAVRQARLAGLRAGLFRPITLWPWPEAALKAAARRARGILVVEMNAGQMREDVERIVGDAAQVAFLGRMGGGMPMPDAIEQVLADLDAATRTRRRAPNGRHKEFWA